MAARPFPGSARFGFSRASRVQAFLAARRFDGNRPMLSAVACAQSRTLRGFLPFPCDVRCLCGPVPLQAIARSAPHSPAVAASSTATLSNAFLCGRLPGARRCRLPVTRMLIHSVMYTFPVGFQRTPGFLCASSLASCVASRDLGRPHETRAKALRAFDAG